MHTHTHMQIHTNYSVLSARGIEISVLEYSIFFVLGKNSTATLVKLQRNALLVGEQDILLRLEDAGEMTREMMKRAMRHKKMHKTLALQ